MRAASAGVWDVSIPNSWAPIGVFVVVEGQVTAALGLAHTGQAVSRGELGHRRPQPLCSSVTTESISGGAIQGSFSAVEPEGRNANFLKRRGLRDE